MANEIYINKIISSLKIKLDKNNSLYRTSYKGDVILSKMKFNEPLDKQELNKIKDICLPEDYISFLEISNGAKFFIDECNGSQGILELYSLSQIIKEKSFYYNNLQSENEYPIGILLDNAELLVDEIALKNKKDYLFLADGSKKFSYSFQEWLDKFIIAQGNEFWILDSPYW
ncbi:SMI1/KNR4 family protein [Clostridium sp. HBUAS56017]|uniref:SMI1/KNR4 family protein n=1 Tax=Clostridium sp. HBUAS56017 TaxID=2571128 RepID=UPI00117773B3|nr:SMI1/KNR4 family protein [Clostridium sp. HBUAS56017]